MVGSPRREYGSLSRDEILDEALALVDGEGLEALSMRALARRLDSAPMSIYRHFQNRAELEAALLDRLFGTSDLEAHAAAPESAPRDFVRSAFLTIRRSLLAHSAVLPLLGATPSFGPEGLSALERILAAAESTGAGPEAAARAVHTLMSFTIGATATEARMRAAGEAGAGWSGLAELDVASLPLLAARGPLLLGQMSDEGFEASLDALLGALLP